MEVLAVGAVDRLSVLQALEHHEGGVQERHGQQDQRQHERHHRGGLHGRLDGDDAHQQAEEIRPAVAHEAGCRREVVEEEAQCRSRGDSRQHARLLTVQVERDHRHGGRDDHAHPRRQAVDAVREVDDVHHRHQADHREDRPGVGGARVGEGELTYERQRDRLHAHAEVHDDHGRQHLAEQLQRRVQIEAVVEGAHQRDDPGGQQHAVPQLCFFAEARGQPDQSGHERAGEDRQPTEQRRGALGQAPLARLVDHARGPRQAHREGRHQRRDDRGGEECVKRVELRWVHHRLVHRMACPEVESGQLRVSPRFLEIYTAAAADRLSYSG